MTSHEDRYFFLSPDGYFTNIFSVGMYWHLVDDQVADVLATNDKVGISKLHSNGTLKKNFVQIKSKVEI